MSVLIKGVSLNDVIVGFHMMPDGEVHPRVFVDGLPDELLPIPSSEARELVCVEVPTPHGRLGDLDRLYKHIKAECNIYGKPTIGFEDGNKVLKIIADTRTVIEAEE